MKFIVALLFGECVVLGIVAITNLLILDNLVHGTLYNYGLQFSYEWANDYWFSMRLALGMIIGMMVSMGVLSILTLKWKRRFVEE